MHYLFCSDVLCKILIQTALWSFKSGGEGTYRILRSPHHSITQGWTGFGLFPLIWRQILELAEKLTTMEFVFCPHPPLMMQLTGPNSSVSAGEWEEFKER